MISFALFVGLVVPTLLFPPLLPPPPPFIPPFPLLLFSPSLPPPPSPPPLHPPLPLPLLFPSQGTTDEHTIYDFATIVLQEVAKVQRGPSSSIRSTRLPQDDPHRRKPDITIALQQLKWRPVVSPQCTLTSVHPDLSAP